VHKGFSNTCVFPEGQPCPHHNGAGAGVSKMWVAPNCSRTLW